jgi:hypothetical protein
MTAFIVGAAALPTDGSFADGMRECSVMKGWDYRQCAFIIIVAWSVLHVAHCTLTNANATVRGGLLAACCLSASLAHTPVRRTGMWSPASIATGPKTSTSLALHNRTALDDSA